MKTRFSLRHIRGTDEIPEGSISPLADWTNGSIPLTTAWTTGPAPSVTLVDGASSDRLRDTTVSGIPAGTYTLNYDIDFSSVNPAFTFTSAVVRFRKAGTIISQQLPDTHGSDPITIQPVQGSNVGRKQITLSDAPDSIEIVIVDPGGSDGCTVVLNELEILGGETVDIAEPGGWLDHEIMLERHPEFCSLIESIFSEDKFVFYGDDDEDGNGGIDFIREAEGGGGVDEKIEMLIEYAPDDNTFEEYFRGLLQLEGMLELPENELEVPLVREDAWQTFLKRWDTPVDVTSLTDLDGNPVDPLQPVTINLTSQKVRKQFDGHLLDPRVFRETELSTNDYIQLDVDNYVLDEIEQKNTIPIVTNPEVPIGGVFSIEDEGEYAFDLRVEASVIYWELDSPNDPCQLQAEVIGSTSYMEVYIQINDETPTAFTKTSSPLILDDISTIYTYTGTKTLKKGDQIKIYGDITADISGLGEFAHLWIYGVNYEGPLFKPTVVVDPDPPNGCATFPDMGDEIEGTAPAPSSESIPTYFRIIADTVYPDTQAQGFWLHDLADAIIKRISPGFNGGLYSEILGGQFTTTRQYDSNGCYSNFVCIKGVHLRGYTMTGDEDDPVQRYTLQQKPFFMSMEQWWDGANPIFNLGICYETLEDSPSDKVIRIEGKSHFYDSTTSVDFDHVYNITRGYDKDMIFKKVTIGYSKWESESYAGIDDPQTKHIYATRAKGVGKEITINSTFIAASLAIETTRRMTVEKSSDYKFDNDTFIITVNIDEASPETSPPSYNPELDENFNSITNLLHSDTRYNLILTPLRSLLRWCNYLTGWLQSYQESSLKFVSGEGNFDMQSDYDCTGGVECQAVICDELTESQDIPLGDPTNYTLVFGYLHLALLYDITIPMEWEQYKSIRDNPKKPIGISQTDSGHSKFYIKSLKYNALISEAKLQAWPKEYMEIRQIAQASQMDC